MNFASLMLVATTALAQRTEPLPKELEGVGVTEHLDAQVPLDLEFMDDDGKPATLGQYFDRKRPVVLTMNYSNCPMLCDLQLTGLFEALGRMKWNIGEEFEMVTVGIDPLETPERARMTKQKYLKTYRRAGAAGGWHFLTGREENIKKLADTVGFHYRFAPESRQYLHVAVTFILTPDGRVSRYLYGVQYDPQTIRLSLFEASEGKVGSTVDRILLFCYHYDAQSGRYGPAAFRLMQVGGGLTVLIVGGVIWTLRRRERRKAHEPQAEDA
ncbi:MAG TPA: SCO family protein [Thermoguttaceae bacterium]|nr:SCO family protein [Thermoguttaceae bacterium]